MILRFILASMGQYSIPLSYNKIYKLCYTTKIFNKRYQKLMANLKLILSFVLGFSIFSTSFAMESDFYILRGDTPTQIQSAQDEFNSLNAHAKLINILIAQAYQIDEKGIVWGNVAPDILDLTRKKHINLMVMVTNHDFNKDIAHQFLTSPSAQTNAINSLIAECKKYHYYGVQFDFEMIPLADENILSDFYEKAAKALHKEGLAVSFAVAPIVSDSLPNSDFLKRIYENWEGAYNLKKLGEAADFLTIMTYNQHGVGTTPGPTATYPWDEQVIRHALKYVPAKKISLGIYTTSGYWFTAKGQNDRIETQLNEISYQEVLDLEKEYKVHLQWDPVNKIDYAIFNRNWLNEYLFVVNARSLAAKLQLVKKYNLRGISVFALGTEDPKIWSVISRSSH